MKRVSNEGMKEQRDEGSTEDGQRCEAGKTTKKKKKKKEHTSREDKTRHTSKRM